jgi:hypothetical protein
MKAAAHDAQAAVMNHLAAEFDFANQKWPMDD